MNLIWHVTVAVFAYLIGSLPTGYLAARAKGIDIRARGSGNIGATNVFRYAGKPAGVAVLVIDAGKGIFACVAAPALCLHWFSAWPGAPPLDQLSVTAGLGVVLGHNYTCWLRFKGGKGIATSAGVLLSWAPWGLLIALGTWIAAMAITRYVSVASIMAALILPWGVWLTHGSIEKIALTAVLSAMAIYKHRGNIQRLRAGTEHRFGSGRHPRETKA